MEVRDGWREWAACDDDNDNIFILMEYNILVNIISKNKEHLDDDWKKA